MNESWMLTKLWSRVHDLWTGEYTTFPEPNELSICWHTLVNKLIKKFHKIVLQLLVCIIIRNELTFMTNRILDITDCDINVVIKKLVIIWLFPVYLLP